MIENYLSSLFRSLWKNKVVSFINIFGLAVGLASIILIFLFVRFELSFDAFWPNSDRIYRAEVTYHNPGGDTPKLSSAPGPFGIAAAEAFSAEIKQVTRVVRGTNRIVKRGDQQFKEPIKFVDSNFFNIFDVPVTAGVRANILSNNNTVMISQNMAIKYFGQNDPIGQPLNIGDIDYVVGAIMTDMPVNTHFQADFIALFDERRWNDTRFEQWSNPTLYTYFLLGEGVDAKLLEMQIPSFLDRTIGVSDTFSPSEFININLVKLPDIHMSSVEEKGDISLIYTFALVAFMIMLIASINFMNLSTARAALRAREVSLRKVLGAKRKQLIFQFLGESITATMFSLVVALAIVELVTPYYNNFLGLKLHLDLMDEPIVLLSLIGSVIIIGTLAGIYPAFVLSSFRPASTLRSSKSSSSGSSKLRNFLVTIQFAISIILVIATVVINSQTNFARDIDPGFERDYRVVLKNLNSDKPSQTETLRNEMLNIPGVLNTTLSQFSLPLDGGWNTSFIPPNKTREDRVMIETIGVDSNFFEFFGIHPLAGRVFSKNFPSDQLIIPESTIDPNSNITFSVVLNESALSKFGFSNAEQALNQIIGFPISADNNAYGTVVGIIPDLMTRSARTEPRANLFLQEQSLLNQMTLHIQSERVAETLSAIDAVWSRLMPETPIDRSLINDNINNFYTQEDKQILMFTYFSVLAIIIATLGLYGLSAYAADRRTKEIGIRKVLGARVIDIVKLLLWQFSRPVLFANLIAWPSALYFMNSWLIGYAYRIDLNLSYFILASVGALAVAWITVSSHTIKVARTNPIRALQHE